jgi:Fe2+ or Zn2+ uptake regulation protein
MCIAGDTMYRFDELIGNKSVVRIMGFLIQNSPNNYNKSQLITELQMGRKTLYDAWKLLDKYNLVATISSDGKSRFYVLNKDNKITVQLMKLYAAIEAD